MFSRRCLKEVANFISKCHNVYSFKNFKNSSKLSGDCFKFRSIHSTSIGYKTYHVGGETNLAHDTLKSTRDRYTLAGEGVCRDDFTLEQFIDTLNPSTSLSTVEIVEAFQVLSDYAHKESIELYSSVFDNFIDILTDNLKHMTDDQLCEVFKHLRKWPPSQSVRTRNFVEIWTALDDVLRDRCDSWNVDQLILFLDHIYRTFLIKKFTVAKYAISKLIRKSKHLSPTQLVQVAFYAGAHRWHHEMFEMEVRFFDCIDFLTIEEIGIVCMGFFKTQTPFRDPHLINTIMNRLQMCKDVPDSILTTSILKMVKYSVRVENNADLAKLFDWLMLNLESLSPMACTHVAIAGTTSRLKHVPLLETLALNFEKNASIVRLKDLERIAGAYSLFNMRIPKNVPIFDIVIEELRKGDRLDEIHKHPTAFVNCLMNIIVMNKFPLDLISYALSSDFVDNYYKHHLHVGKSLHVVNNSVTIEQKKLYKGSFLNEKDQMLLSKKYFRYMPERGAKYKLNTEQINVLDIMATIANHRGNWKYVKGLHLLPHFDKGDLIIANGTTENPIRVENYFPKKEFGKIYNAPDKVKTWLAIMPVVPQGFTWDKPEPTGPTLMKKRQLEAIGYTTVMLPLMEWQELKNTFEKVDYLKNLFMTVNFKF